MSISYLNNPSAVCDYSITVENREESVVEAADAAALSASDVIELMLNDMSRFSARVQERG